MRLIKLLRRIYRNKIEILDLNDEVLFRGLYDSQTALTVKLLSAHIIDFGPSLIFCADIEPEDIGKFSSYYEAYRHDKSEYNKLKSFLHLNSRIAKRMNNSKSNNTDLDVAVGISGFRRGDQIDVLQFRGRAHWLDHDKQVGFYVG